MDKEKRFPRVCVWGGVVFIFAVTVLGFNKCFLWRMISIQTALGFLFLSEQHFEAELYQKIEIVQAVILFNLNLAWLLNFIRPNIFVCDFNLMYVILEIYAIKC